MRKHQVGANTHTSTLYMYVYCTMEDQDRSLHATEGGPVTSRQTKEVNKLLKLCQVRVAVAMVSFGAARAQGTVQR